MKLQRRCTDYAEMITRKRHAKVLLVCACVIAGIVLLDQFVKMWARTVLRNSEDGRMPLMPGVLSLQYAENTGAAFSMWSGQAWLLGVLSAVLSAVIIWMLYKWRSVPSLTLRLSLCFIAGGAVGNVIDRISLGHVVDMFDFEFVRFAVFNVADSFVCVGAVMFCIYILFLSRSSEQAQMR